MAKSKRLADSEAIQKEAERKRISGLLKAIKWFVYVDGLECFVNNLIERYQLAQPCPFCGAAGSYVHTNENAHWMQCSECGAQTDSASEIDDAISIWNRRAQ